MVSRNLNMPGVEIYTWRGYSSEFEVIWTENVGCHCVSIIKFEYHAYENPLRNSE